MNNPVPTFTSIAVLTWRVIDRSFEWFLDRCATFCIWVSGATPCEDIVQRHWLATEPAVYVDHLPERKVYVIDRFHAYYGETGVVDHEIVGDDPSFMVSFPKLPGCPVAILSPIQFVDNELVREAA